MTLGACGGTVKPLTREGLLALPPVIDLRTLARALGVSEPVVREMRRRGKLEEMGIRVLTCGAQYRIPVADVLRVLGINPDMAAGGASETPPANAAATLTQGNDYVQRTSA